MENASKALIIAGAILLSIVIISLGLVVVNNVRDTINGANLDAQEIQSFNDQFLAYEGTISGTKVNEMAQKVIAVNQAAINAENVTKRVNEVTGELEISCDSDATEVTVTTGRVSTGTKYDVTFTYTNGLISAIDVQPHTP